MEYEKLPQREEFVQSKEFDEVISVGDSGNEQIVLDCGNNQGTLEDEIQSNGVKRN